MQPSNALCQNQQMESSQQEDQDALGQTFGAQVNLVYFKLLRFNCQYL